MKGKTVKRLAAFAVALAMIGSSLSAELGGIGLFDGFSLTASAAQEAVSYTVYSWNNSTKTLSETTKTITDYKVVTKDIIKNSEDGNGILSGTYVVTQNTTVEDHLYIRKGCTVNLIVPKGVTLTCNKGIGCGYDGNQSATLNIYGDGKIVANGKKYAAGIGGKDDETNGNITIHGTEIEATGGHHGAGIGGGEGGQDPDGTTSIKIYAGDITATGGIDGAGIGGGDCQPGAHTYIYSGNITASSEKHGAGIGGGDEEGTYGVHIYSGKINATGGEHGAGIGAGEGGGNLRKKSDGGGVNIYGGTVTATGGKNAAGIGGGYNEDVSGEINISGESTKLTATGVDGAAGIGAGRAERGVISTDKGDMGGTITINCGKSSELKICGGDNHKNADSYNSRGGAGIGAGFGGNLYGKVYIKGGNIGITSGYNAAGIGGGSEDGSAGGEGGDVYIGGGNIMIHLQYDALDGKDSEAIGAGHADSKSGSVYIHKNNNTTGKYMSVSYKPYGKDDEAFKTVSASDRSKKCHTRSTLLIRECDEHFHEAPEGSSGLTYIIDDKQHIGKCQFCGYEDQGPHESELYCYCGYKSGNACDITIITQYGSPVQMDASLTVVASGKKFLIPECDKKPTGMRFIGWAINGDDDPSNLKKPGETITITSDTTLNAQYAELYHIRKNTNVPNGWIDASKYSADVDDKITVRSEPDAGYKLKSVTVRENDAAGTEIFKKTIHDGNTSFEFDMPDSNIYIDAEFELITRTVFISGTEHGTVTADKQIIGAGSDNVTVTLTVKSDTGYHLETITCSTYGGEETSEVKLTKVDDTHYTFEMPSCDVRVTAEFEEDEDAQSYISSASISVDGEIGVNLYIKPGNNIGSGYVKVKGPNDTDAKKVELTDEIFDTAEKAYKVSCPVYAPQMGEKVEFTLFDENNVQHELWNSAKTRSYETYRYAVNDYIETVQNSENAPEKLKAIADKMQNFGACARDSLIANNQISSDTAEIAEPKEVTGIADSIFESNTVVKSTDFDVEGLNVSLFLDSETALRVYYTGDEINGITAKHGDETIALTSGTSRDMNYVEIKNISAYNLGDDYVITFGDKGTLKVSPYSYCCIVMNKSNDVKLKNTVKALYEYCKAAKSFFDKQ